MSKNYQTEQSELRDLIKRLNELDEKDLVEANMDEFYEIESSVQDIESQKGGIYDMDVGEYLDRLIERAKRIIKRIKSNYSLYDEDEEWDDMFPNQDNDDDEDANSFPDY